MKDNSNKNANCNLGLEEPTIFEQSQAGRVGFDFGKGDVPNIDAKNILGASLWREGAPNLPELSEVDVTRHFTRLSTYNYSKDLGFYPLGSCTMKHNPKVASQVASFCGFTKTHPYQDATSVQGNLELLFDLQTMLADIGGMDAVTLWPAAGSHGELTGMLMIRAYHTSQGNSRQKVIIPDSAHGTNPASAALCGYQVVQIKSNEEGVLDPEHVAAVMDEEVAAIMITNPNTLGVFEKHFGEIAKIVHDKGGLVYCDGANLNALMGYVRLGEIGCDVMHFNLHKTFGTPHGGGGPGAGPVGVKKILEPFLPNPIVVKDNKGNFKLETASQSIGRIKSFYGNFSVLVRAYVYLKELGSAGLQRATELAVLNANYIRARLKNAYHLPYNDHVLHECVFSDKIQNEYGIKTLDIAKRLMDYGFHPPTVYFPLIVPGALMIEPTETENKQLLDSFCEAMLAIAEEAKNNPELVKNAPHKTFRARLDEVKAAREPCLKK
ncbi:MAG: aminomethyl-transferring glycine dehydrogenase subunit GcvPB [Pseudomonadota bacterium]